jgi:hypothetical protein
MECDVAQSASTKASGSAQKSSVISVACERRFSFLSTAPKNNNDDFDFAAGFLSTFSPRTRTPNDDPASIGQSLGNVRPWVKQRGNAA